MDQEVLWTHPSPASTNLSKFTKFVNKKHGLSISSYSHLHRWSVQNANQFWSDVEEFVGIDWDQKYDHAIDPSAPMFPPQVAFSGAKLNFAKNLLFPSTPKPIDDSKPAIISATEFDQEVITWKELRQQVATCQRAMAAVGLKSGDRVAGVVGNHSVAVVSMLAATSLGAIWTSVSPDTGVFAIVERMKQIRPVMLIVDAGTIYNGKPYSLTSKIEQLIVQLPSLKNLVVVPIIPDAVTILKTPDNCHVPEGYCLSNFLELGRGAKSDPYFVPHPPNHPVYILYSSGTTGAPKCIVHGAAGTLIQHKKEHAIHCDIGLGSVVFYYTTTTWMMWHWLVSALGSGATVVLYDGSPFSRDGKADHYAMPRVISDLRVTHFGTSAKYLSVLEQKREGNKLPSEIDTSCVRALYSTGSPLAPSTYRFVYSELSPFPKTVQLSSITGGTDIISLFGAPCALRPVQPGLIQCPGLGMAMRSFDENGVDVTAQGGEGDLVCVSPFVCQPVGFWAGHIDADNGGDGDAAAANKKDSLTVQDHLDAGLPKYRDAYFAKFGPQVWHHGDHVRFVPDWKLNMTENDTQGEHVEKGEQPQQPRRKRQKGKRGKEIVTAPNTTSTAPLSSPSSSSDDDSDPLAAPFIILGRSDGVLKPAGVRFGSAELYNLVLAQFGAQVSDAVAIGWRKDPDEPDEQVALFLKLSWGEIERREKMKKEHREERKRREEQKDEVGACDPKSASGKEGKEGEGGVDGTATKAATNGDTNQDTDTNPDAQAALVLHTAIKTAIRTALSPRHVPAYIAECEDVPITANGKKMEVLVRRLAEGKVRVEDVENGVANPECLSWFVQWAKRTREGAR